MTTYRGAYATIQWSDNKQIVEDCYFSFGGEVYDEDGDPQRDSFGVSDLDIFYFCKDEDELAEMKTMQPKNTDENWDFRVLDYKLVEAQNAL